MKTNWAPQQLALLNQNLNSDPRTLARKLNRDPEEVRKKLWHLNAKNRRNVAAATEAEEPLVDFWKRTAEQAQRDLREAKRDTVAIEVLVNRAEALAPKTYQPPKIEIARWPQSKKSAPQSAVLVFSDTHIGQVVKADQTLGLGNYNFEIFLRRLARLERSVISILQDHTTVRVPELVIAMLGDMIHGNLSHAVEAGQVNTLFTQFYSAGHAIAQFFRNLSVVVPLRIKTVVGNHPRWATQKKMPTENRFSNLDQFLYAYVQALLRDIPRIQFELSPQPFSLFEVQGHVFYAGHGDHLKGGDRILGIPNHALGRNLSNTSQLFASAQKRFPNYFLFGHFHRPITLPHASGEIIINGGFPGLDGFGLMEAFNSSHPSQKFFLVHPKFGRSACYDLRLDLGDAEKHGYKLPTEFPCQ